MAIGALRPTGTKTVGVKFQAPLPCVNMNVFLELRPLLGLECFGSVEFVARPFEFFFALEGHDFTLVTAPILFGGAPPFSNEMVALHNEVHSARPNSISLTMWENFFPWFIWGRSKCKVS